ncbi:MAG: AN1-type zinc finger domain-containing protein [Candidatus Thorarchaeota archaeon]
MPTCSLCGHEDLSFTCPYCNGVFCGEHRLPESHGCPGIQKVREAAQRRVTDSLGFDEYDEESQTWTPVTPQKKPKRRSSKRSRFSTTERRDLLIASLLVILVSISIFGTPSGIINGVLIFASFISGPNWWVPVGMISIFLLSFMGHELAHKFTAQHYGMWSEFRMTSMGYYLSAIAILFSIPIFGTGTVYTSGTTSREDNAKTNLAGPLSNFFIATGLMIVAILAMLLLSPGSLFYIMFLVQYGIIINSILGLFNMIPIQPFDGATVKDWSKPVWIVITIALLSMLIIGYLVIPILM